VIIEPGSSPDQSRQINHFPPDGILAKDKQLTVMGKTQGPPVICCSVNRGFFIAILPSRQRTAGAVTSSSQKWSSFMGRSNEFETGVLTRQ